MKAFITNALIIASSQFRAPEPRMPLFCNLLPFLRLAKLLENVLQTDTHMHCVVFSLASLLLYCTVFVDVFCFFRSCKFCGVDMLL